MNTISLCMIVKNEEEVLARCLDSMKNIADEIIIVDTGSTDRTKEFALAYTNKVYDFPWINDFSAARNFAFSKASMDYCMWLDADDVLLERDAKGLLALKEQMDPSTDVVMMRYNIAFDSNGIPTFSYYRERLLRRSSGFQWEGAVHEAITPKGKILYSEFAITHKKNGPGDPDRNLNIYEKLIANGKTLEPREQFYYGRELYFHARFEDAITVFELFLDTGKGWLENCIDACQLLSYCYSQLGEDERALTALLRSLSYDSPRAEICCDIGKHFFDRERYHQAIFWYELAASRERNDRAGGFVKTDCYGYIPYLQLCVCYDKLGNWKKASEYNEKAGYIKPDDKIVAQNRVYFSNRFSEE